MSQAEKAYFAVTQDSRQSGLLNDFFRFLDIGAESGPKARPFNEDWARSLRDQCAEAGVPFFYKQRIDNGRKIELPELDGVVHAAFPEVP